MENLKGTLAERVRDLRRERNLSQQELGNVFGIDKGTISKIENGKTINSDFALSNGNQRKFTDNINLNFNKEGLTINSNYKAPFINKRLFLKVDSLLHKDKLTKNESEFVLNYIEKRRDCESSPRHKINANNLKSPRNKKKQRKRKNNVKFKEQNMNNLEEKEKNQTEKTDNQQNDDNNHNIILYEMIPDKPKLKWFNAFLCCFKKN